MVAQGSHARPGDKGGAAGRARALIADLGHKIAQGAGGDGQGQGGIHRAVQLHPGDHKGDGAQGRLLRCSSWRGQQCTKFSRLNGGAGRAEARNDGSTNWSALGLIALR